MNRTVAPEILDLLPADDVRAQRSRRDLRRINGLMGNGSWWRGTVAPVLRAQDRVLEIGAGDAGFPLLPDRGVDGLDRLSRPAHWPLEARWHAVAVQDFRGWNEYDAIVGNLVFHHLNGDELARLGETIAPSCRVIAACEPLRARRFQRLFSALRWFVAASDVTRHDAIVSIAAGFRAGELPRALGLIPTRWAIHEEHTTRGAYRMLAVRSP